MTHPPQGRARRHRRRQPPRRAVGAGRSRVVLRRLPRAGPGLGRRRRPVQRAPRPRRRRPEPRPRLRGRDRPRHREHAAWPASPAGPRSSSASPTSCTTRPTSTPSTPATPSPCSCSLGVVVLAAALVVAAQPPRDQRNWGATRLDQGVEALELAGAPAEGEVGDDDLVEADGLPVGHGLGDVVGGAGDGGGPGAVEEGIRPGPVVGEEHERLRRAPDLAGSRPIASHRRSSTRCARRWCRPGPTCSTRRRGGRRRPSSGRPCRRSAAGAGLDGLRLADGVGELVVLAGEGGDGLPQQPLPHLARLLEPLDALAGRRQPDAVLLVLVLLPAGARRRAAAARR